MLAIYARVSQDKDDEKNSIETQIALGKTYAQTKGLSYEIYEDNGVSGTLEIEKRPALYELVKDIASKKITHVFSYDQSRLERNNAVWSTLYLLFQRDDIKLYFYNTGDFDFLEDKNFLMSNMLSIFNSFYVKLTKKKVVTALQRNVEAGKVHASPPFGYTKDSNKTLIINEKESKIVERIYQMSLEGKGTDKIAEILNLEEVPTAYSKLAKGGVYKVRDKYNPNLITEKKKSDAKWRGRTIQGIIKNTIYKGQRFWRGNYYPAPAIFDEVYWQKVNENLQNNRNNTGKKVEHKYLLKGIIKCNCGRNMYGRSRVNKRDHTYICSSRRYKGENCGNRAINIDKIEKIIWEHFFIRKELLELLNNSSGSQNKILEELKQEESLLDKKIEDNHKSRNNLVRAISNGVINDEDAKDEINKIKENLAKYTVNKALIASRVADVQNFESLLVDTRTDFENFSRDVDFDTKRNLIHKYVERIIVVYDDGREYKNGVKYPPYTYHIQIEFKNGIVKENYIYNVKNNIIMSLRDRTFKLLTGNGIVETMDSDMIDKSIIPLSNGKFLLKPFLGKDNCTYILDNTIIPHGDLRTWDVKKIVDFYTLNKTWLCKESGINILTENKTDESYQWFVRNYKNYQDKPIIEWVTFLFESFNYNDLLVASKARIKSKLKE
ncbi:recombinase family protein [uncultured Chryseobacterium sp.]|uniref:recombinase family protein n=1 Tax=uncultured Chryseobacterium sp. TaxID=259322 RepID=UPI0025E23492|nr:recombinase family protein [uncultured Chryseobacterium sp.]